MVKNCTDLRNRIWRPTDAAMSLNAYCPWLHQDRYPTTCLKRLHSFVTAARSLEEVQCLLPVAVFWVGSRAQCSYPPRSRRSRCYYALWRYRSTGPAIRALSTNGLEKGELVSVARLLRLVCPQAMIEARASSVIVLLSNVA